MNKPTERITFEVDKSQLFDTVAQIGDGGQAVGVRLVGTLLGGRGFCSDLGLAVYGITICDEPPRALTTDTTGDQR
jgi:hypothetical protein